MYKAVGILGGMGVVLGAFGAHLLKRMLSSDQLSSWNTAVDYHLLHAAVLLIFCLILERKDSKVVRLSYRLMLIGVVLFSGSIYFLCLQNVLGVNLSILGPVTPIGGVLLIAAWFNLIRYKVD